MHCGSATPVRDSGERPTHGRYGKMRPRFAALAGMCLALAWLLSDKPAVAARLRASGVAVNAREGLAFDTTLAVFQDRRAHSRPADFTVRINWGDGSASLGSVTADLSGGFRVSGAHAYAKKGAYAIRVRIHARGGARTTTHGAAEVTEAPLWVVGRRIGAPVVFTADERWLYHVYYDLLHREVEDEGREFWAGLLRGGATRVWVAERIASSLEYRTRLIHHLHSALLNRPPSRPELDGALARLERGEPIEAYQASLLGSEEYFRVRGGTLAVAFAQALYRDVLGRESQASEQRRIRRSLRKRASRRHIAGALLESLEARERTAQRLHRWFLLRSASRAELAPLVRGLRGGARLEEAMAVLAASAEYGQRTTAALASGRAFQESVALLRDDNPYSVAEDYAVRIQWDDRSFSPGVVVTDPFFGFKITGGHVYAQPGSFPVRVTVMQQHSAATAAESRADVTGPATGAVRAR